MFADAKTAWLMKSASADTKTNYDRDLRQFLAFIGVPATELEHLAGVRPAHVAAWRDSLKQQGLTNASILRKMTTLRSLYSYLQVYGYSGQNPAHGDLVAAPPASRDGKTVALSPEDCRRLLDAPDPMTPAGVRDRALLALHRLPGRRADADESR